MLQRQVLDVSSFHGGMNDNFIDAPVHQFEIADNFLITSNQKLYTRPGSDIWDSDNAQIPAGTQRINALIEHNDELFITSSKKLYYMDSGSLTTLEGPSLNDVFTQGDIESVPFWSFWKDHTFIGNDDFSPIMKLFRDDSGDLICRSAGLPALASEPSIAGVAGTYNYIYAFYYSYEYKVGNRTHLDAGYVTEIRVTDINEPSVDTVNITNIPVISNGTDFNYDTANIKVKIYRTRNNGTSLYYIGEVDNGTTIYNDSGSDDSIINNSLIYTTGDVVANEAPPICKTMHITNGYGYYGHIRESATEINAYRILQSHINDVDSVPSSFYVDTDDAIVALSSVGQIPIVLCENEVYRIDGNYDSQGNGGMVLQKLTDSVGCISAGGVLRLTGVVVFPGNDNFYATDGYKVWPLNTNWEDTFATFTNTAEKKRRIRAAFDKKYKRIWWAVQESDLPGDDCDKCYILDARWGLLSEVQAVYTSASNGENFAPTALAFINKELIRADRRGYIFRHSDEYRSDPLIDITKAVANWDTTAIIWNYKSTAISFGNPMMRKWVPRMVLRAENASNISIQINSINDVGAKTHSVASIRFRKNKTWGDPLDSWRTETDIWNFKGLIEEQRHMNANGLRCSYKQIQITNAFVNIAVSDQICEATTNFSAKTVTLNETSTYDWPLDLSGHSIYFEYDDYQQAFEITARTDDTLTVLDPNNLLPEGNDLRWAIKGYPKDEILNLIGYSLEYSYLGKTQDRFMPASVGDNE